MVITYYGEGCFRLQSGELSILTDPQNNRLKADVILETITPADSVGDPDKISFAGEYEVKGIEIQGFGIPEESTDKFVKTIYSIKFEDVNFLILGHISQIPNPDILDELVEPDVVIIPTGREHFMPSDEAAKLIKKLEPSIVIPSFYKDTDGFLKALGQKGEFEEKIVFKKKDIGESQRVVVLKAS